MVGMPKNALLCYIKRASHCEATGKRIGKIKKPKFQKITVVNSKSKKEKKKKIIRLSGLHACVEPRATVPKLVFIYMFLCLV